MTSSSTSISMAAPPHGRTSTPSAEVQKLPYAKASMASNEVAKPKPTIPQASEMTDILVRELSSYLADEKTAKEALDALREGDLRAARLLRADEVSGAVTEPT